MAQAENVREVIQAADAACCVEIEGIPDSYDFIKVERPREPRHIVVFDLDGLNLDSQQAMNAVEMLRNSRSAEEYHVIMRNLSTIVKQENELMEDVDWVREGF